MHVQGANCVKPGFPMIHVVRCTWYRLLELGSVVIRLDSYLYPPVWLRMPEREREEERHGPSSTSTSEGEERRAESQWRGARGTHGTRDHSHPLTLLHTNINPKTSPFLALISSGNANTSLHEALQASPCPWSFFSPRSVALYRAILQSETAVAPCRLLGWLAAGPCRVSANLARAIQDRAYSLFSHDD